MLLSWYETNTYLHIPIPSNGRSLAENLHRPRAAALHTQDSGYCCCCDRDAWRHLRLFFGHDNNNNSRYLSSCALSQSKESNQLDGDRENKARPTGNNQ
ncbi:hypothetical protein LAZ67_1004451 [Cordylochernes scorpioides]|uniref:Uncharacterized protein n=1 Tax=Cordylochernes scorpioides TaxID=51811 RepID=A0ABY6JXG3_9ARAC|nr:hypothetical protein LAZ67_1004451 [Cordylochernes scorpioides]